MKTLKVFNDACAVQISIDAVMSNDKNACFVLGVPITVHRGQQLIITTAGVVLVNLEEPYNEDIQDA